MEIKRERRDGALEENRGAGDVRMVVKGPVDLLHRAAGWCGGPDGSRESWSRRDSNPRPNKQ